MSGIADVKLREPEVEDEATGFESGPGGVDLLPEMILHRAPHLSTRTALPHSMPDNSGQCVWELHLDRRRHN